MKIYSTYCKGALDFVVALLILLVLSPLLLVVAILVKIFLGSPILFKQQRPGLNAKPFVVYKFRTMKDSYDAEGKLLPDAERLTKFGKFLRSTSIDELPQLLNVVKGDMSLIGPRPFLLEYLPRYNKEQARRHLVRPGITGLAQVNGRNSISWEEKFKLDVSYVDNLSLLLDLKILWQTLMIVLTRKGVSQEGSVTMEEFKGSKN